VTRELSGSALDDFRAVLARRFGWCFVDARAALLGEVLEHRHKRTGRGAAAYLAFLDSADVGDAALAAELRTLARELTVGETYFFRHREQFCAFEEVALPDRLAASERPLRILSAGCASGEEVWTLAILLSEHALGPERASIRGVDVNPAALERAAAAHYSDWSLRETPADTRRRWFRPAGRDHRLVDALRPLVSFEERNLSCPDPELWAPGSYDVVFCRNVMMYFAPEVAQALVARIRRALRPGGYLFLGHAETLRGLSQDFALRHTHNTFYYTRKDALHEPAAPRPALRATPVAAPVPVLPLPLVEAAREVPWLETVQRATARVGRLADGARRPAPVPAGVPRVDLRPALDLLQQERFAEALDRLGEPDAGGDVDPEHLLLRAVLLAHSGRTGSAERVCGELLAHDELNAGAHYVLALCREATGDRKAAVDHDQAATYLDPTFAMPRLHLGLMARRAGDRETALAELAQAVLLLQREDSSRLLLFAGGFRREALIELCRAELGAAGNLP
jgi:chemotaxis protein methyltransferase CheR